MTYNVSPDEPPPPPPDADEPLPGQRRREQAKIEIEDDLFCVHCGYNLRGLTKKHRCLECGTPAGFSVKGDSLLYAPVPWLQTVRNGLAMMLWALGVIVASIVNWNIAIGLSMLLEVIAAALAWVAIMFITMPEPREIYALTGHGLRRTIRVLAAVDFACALVIIFSPSVGLAAVMARVSLIPWSAMLLALAMFLRSLASRNSEYDLERSTTHVIWGLSSSLSVFAFFGLFSLLFEGFGRITGPAPFLSSLGWFCTGIFAAWFMWLLYKYYVMMRWATHVAQTQFESPPAPKLELESTAEDWSDVRS